MIKLAVDAREYSVPGRSTGIGRFLENITTPLAAGQEFQFVFYTHHPESVPARLTSLPGIEVRQLPRAQTQWVDQWVLPRAARQEGADLFFSPYYKGPLMPGMPLIVTVHDIMFLRLPGLSPMVYWLTKFQLASVLRRCDRVIVVSRFSERDLIDLFPRAAEKTVVLYSDMGADWHRMLQDRAMRQAPSIAPACSGRFFLYVGNFKPHKNVDMLLRGYQQGLKQGSLAGYHLVLVGGDDQNEPRIRKLIRDLGIVDRVTICRDIDDYSLSRLYQTADWFITASSYEGFGYPCVEAMVAGCPVICHQATSLIEVVGSAGLPISALNVEQVATAMSRAAEIRPEERDQFIQAGRRQARLFAPGETAQAFAGICRCFLHPK